MRRTPLLFTILLLSAALPLLAQTPPPVSLGDLARQLRQQHDKDAKKATKVFTNDNLPAPSPGEAVSSSPPAPENPSTPAPTTSKPATPPPSEETSSKQPESPDDKIKTRDYWQEKFRAARRELAKAKELQQLSEDELNLLQIQQVREINPITQAGLTTKVQAKQSEVEVNKAATDAARKNLDDLEMVFEDSGAPDGWSQTE